MYIYSHVSNRNVLEFPVYPDAILVSHHTASMPHVHINAPYAVLIKLTPYRL